MQENYKHIITIVVINVVVFGLTYIAQDTYLFGWIMHNNINVFIAALSLVLVIFNLTYTSYSLLVGHILSLVIAYFLGSFINTRHLAKITADMSNAEVYRLQTRYDVFIWFISLVIILIVSLSIHCYKLSQEKRQENLE